MYNSLSDHQNHEEVLPAAVSIELLREYVRLRSRLFTTLTDKDTHSLTLDPTAALLTGYYLYTASFSSLGSISGPQSDGCFGVLTTVIETITEAFARTYTSAGSTDCEEAVFLDETAGSLGAGAAALGATLADFDDAVRPHCERLGRNLGTARQFRAIIERDSNKAMVASPTFDESQFRLHAERRRDDVDKALDTLSKTVDVTNLRAFAEATTLRLEQQTSDTNDNTLN